MARPADRRAGSVALLVFGAAFLWGACGRGTTPARDVATEAPAFRVVTDSLLGVRDGSTYRLVRLMDSKRVVHEAWLRFGPRRDSPSAAPATPWRPVLILGGIGTGRRAAEITPCPPGFVLVALDYPYTGPRAPTRSELLREVPAIRKAALATPRGVAAFVEWLARRPDVDSSGVLVVGASFGVPFVVRGLADLPRARTASGRDAGPRGVRGVCLLFGGADLPGLVRYRMRERPLWEREAVALGLVLLFGDLEPARHVARISPRPLLLVGGTRDEFVPRSSTDALYRAAREPKTQLWFESEHLQPDAEDLLNELVTRSLEWDRSLESRNGRR
ncbi:MAG: hypothetical protein ACREOU_11780 [Candidatus Eiseniibacteriota bacterium]